MVLSGRVRQSEDGYNMCKEYEIWNFDKTVKWIDDVAGYVFFRCVNKNSPHYGIEYTAKSVLAWLQYEEDLRFVVWNISHGMDEAGEILYVNEHWQTLSDYNCLRMPKKIHMNTRLNWKRFDPNDLPNPDNGLIVYNPNIQEFIHVTSLNNSMIKNSAYIHKSDLIRTMGELYELL